MEHILKVQPVHLCAPERAEHFPRPARSVLIACFGGVPRGRGCGRLRGVLYDLVGSPHFKVILVRGNGSLRATGPGNQEVEPAEKKCVSA